MLHGKGGELMITYDMQHQRAMEHLRGLPKHVERNVAKTALQECAKPLRRDMQQRLEGYIGRSLKGKPRSTGAMKKAVVVTSMRNRPGMPVMVLVGITKKAASKVPALTRRKVKGGGVASYWWSFHNGRAGQPRRPFVKEAADASKGRNAYIVSRVVEAGVKAYGKVSES